MTRISNLLRARQANLPRSAKRSSLALGLCLSWANPRLKVGFFY
jgi:hypothetical protein